MPEQSPLPPDLDDLARFIVSGPADGTVYTVGDPATEVFIIQEGEIELQTGPDPSRGDGSLLVIGPGDVFGDEAFFSSRFRTTTARARSGFKLLKLEMSTLARIFQEDPEVALAMIRSLLLRSREIARTRDAVPRGAPAESVGPKADSIQVNPVPGSVEEMPKHPAPAKLVHDETGSEFDIQGDRDLVVGRVQAGSRLGPDIDLTSVDPNKVVSRRHALILATSRGYSIREDTATRNGTYVNGTRLETGLAAALQDGDELRFGTVRMRFRVQR